MVGHVWPRLTIHGWCERTVLALSSELLHLLLYLLPPSFAPFIGFCFSFTLGAGFVVSIQGFIHGQFFQESQHLFRSFTAHAAAFMEVVRFRSILYGSEGCA